jgi:hypothetical protein
MHVIDVVALNDCSAAMLERSAELQLQAELLKLEDAPEAQRSASVGPRCSCCWLGWARLLPWLVSHGGLVMWLFKVAAVCQLSISMLF